jgi:hypothetical protein
LRVDAGKRERDDEPGGAGGSCQLFGSAVIALADDRQVR